MYFSHLIFFEATRYLSKATRCFFPYPYFMGHSLKKIPPSHTTTSTVLPTLGRNWTKHVEYPIAAAEQELVAQCRRQDRQAQKTLFLKYKDAMYTILCRMLNDEDEATDALQETFIAVFEGLGSYKAKSTLGAWIKTIAVRKGIARQKKRMAALATEAIEEVSAEPITWPDGMTSEALEAAIRKLSDGYRNVFLLIEVEGYAHREVSEMLGISEGTSKSQLYHAKKALQKMLEEYRYDR
jgi:RNA polymerase sigma-70 factor (ECF subfamily)